MRLDFSYSDVPPLEVPDANFLACLEPCQIAEAPPTEALVERALSEPIGSPRLEALASPAARVLILTDDITRQTPAHLLLPAILARLATAGVPASQIRILIAAGTHSPMTAAEVERKLGREVVERHSVSVHYWKAAGNLTVIGTTDDGTPILVHRQAIESDLVIGVGQIVPHRVMGYTGGSSIVQPGISGAEVTGYTHWASALYAGSEILGVAENPVRREVERIARLAGLRFIVNVVMGGSGRVAHVVAGDPVAAHRRGAEHSRAIFGASAPDLADVVITESYPADYDLWQAAKGIFSAELAVREGGVVIVVTPCPHGVAAEHPEVERIGYLSVEEAKARVARREIADLVAAAHLAHVGRIIRDRARGIMVSPGIRPEVQRHLGFESAGTPQDALARALTLVGHNASVMFLRQGGHVLPVLESAAGAA
jgi:nickel-dependent lactate racemase